MKTFVVTTITLAITSSCALADTRNSRPTHLEFEEMSMIFELNATDGDAEMVIYAKAPEGMSGFKLTNDRRQSIASLRVNRNKNPIGAQQVTMESGEPGIDEVKVAYPEGTYYFSGRTISGDLLKGEIMFNHNLPMQPQIDVCDMDIDPGNAVISWQGNAGTDSFVVEVENDDLGNTFEFKVSGDTTSLTLPSEILQPGLEYEIAVGAFAENGNLIVTECSFTTR